MVLLGLVDMVVMVEDGLRVMERVGRVVSNFRSLFETGLFERARNREEMVWNSSDTRQSSDGHFHGFFNQQEIKQV